MVITFPWSPHAVTEVAGIGGRSELDASVLGDVGQYVVVS